MRTIEANGAKIRIPPACDCGEVCSDEIAANHVLEWNRLASTCAFCGQIIRVVCFTMKHYHREEGEKEPSRWSSDDWVKYEPNWSWFESGMYGRVNIDAHISCAKKGMPYANFERTVYGIDRPEIIQDKDMPKEISAGPCLLCGVLPTDEDIRRVAARVFNFRGPCVYCGKSIKLRKLALFHGDLTGKHTGHWHFEDYDREPTLHWEGYKQESSRYERLEFTGHLLCAVRMMPYAVWYEVNRSAWELLLGKGTN